METVRPSTKDVEAEASLNTAAKYENFMVMLSRIDRHLERIEDRLEELVKKA